MSWKPHITELTKRLARTSGIFYKIRHYVPPYTLKLLYYSLFYSFISYGITVWGLTHPSYMDPLWKLQKKVIQTIAFKDKYAHTTPPFHEFKIMTTLVGGILVTNYHDAGRKVSKSNLDRGRKQKRPLHQTAVDTWRG